MKVFIGHDTRWKEATTVLLYSLRQHSGPEMGIELLEQAKLPARLPHEARTQFSFLRYLIPHLMNFQGRALYLEQDMLALDDVRKIERELPAHDNWSIACVQHGYASSVKRPNWASVMVLNCAKLTQWTLEAYKNKPREWLHELQGVPDSEFIPLNARWNVLDHMQEGAGILHYTSGGPWDRKVGERPPDLKAFDLWKYWAARAGVKL